MEFVTDLGLPGLAISAAAAVVAAVAPFWIRAQYSLRALRESHVYHLQRAEMEISLARERAELEQRTEEAQIESRVRMEELAIERARLELESATEHREALELEVGRFEAEATDARGDA
jgi:hypothetical protein